MFLWEMRKLLERIKQEDQEAFKELSDWFQPVMRNVYSRYYFEDLDWEDFEVEGEWLLFVISLEYPLEDVKAFCNYYRKSLNNLACKFVQREKVLKKVPRNLLVSEYEEELTPDGQLVPADTLLIMREDEGEYRKQLSTLEEEVYEGLKIGLSKKELSEKLGKSIKNIRNVVARCRRKFAKLFKL